MGPQESTPSGATTLYIIGRRMKLGRRHKHVDRVLLSDGKTKLSRKQVLGLMKLGVVFKTRAKNGESAKVIGVECGTCHKTCLRTDADRSKPDNLDELELFY